MLDVFNPLDAAENLQAFRIAGGNVLVVIMGVTFLMWLFALERVIYFSSAAGGVTKRALSSWGERHETKSWYAHSVRAKTISEVSEAATQNIGVIRALIAVLPLLGLLGTVTGMVLVFDVLAVTGSSNARLLASGITKATIPTMAGLGASLSGIFMLNVIEHQAKTQVAKVTDKLVVG